jgi:hypothetical protein
MSNRVFVAFSCVQVSNLLPINIFLVYTLLGIDNLLPHPSRPNKVTWSSFIHFSLELLETGKLG